MSVSGILVRTRSDRMSRLATSLGELPGVRVHQQDPENGRLVVTLEAGSVDEEIEGLRRIQKMPGVISADLVYHWLPEDDAATSVAAAAPSPASEQGES